MKKFWLLEQENGEILNSIKLIYQKNTEEDRNDEKMRQIRIFLYQLYPIYKIKNNC